MSTQASQSGEVTKASGESAEGRLIWIDIIRAGGAFLVVLAHVILYPGLRGAGPVWAQALYYTASRVAVPLFFMASGFLLLGKQESYADFFRKRALRVLIPFLVWSLVYLAWNVDVLAGPFTAGTIGDALLRILRGPRASHLWFFYVLISLYLFTPVLRLFTINARLRDLAYFCGLWFVLDPLINLLRHETGVQVGFEFGFVTGYIGYYVLGHLLGRVRTTRAWIVACGLLALATFTLVFASVYAGMQAPEYDQFLEGYLSAPAVLMTAAVFILARSLGKNIGSRAAKTIRLLSGASLGIYLLHVLALDLIAMSMAGVWGEAEWGSSIWLMPATAAVTLLICWVIVIALQRIPIAKYAVP